MAGFTVEQYKEAARKALAGGDPAAAKRLIDAGRALEAQGAQPAQTPVVPPASTPPVPQGMPAGAMAELSALSTPGQLGPQSDAQVDLANQWRQFDSANPEVPEWLTLDRTQAPPQAGKVIYGPSTGTSKSGAAISQFTPQDPRLGSGQGAALGLANVLTLGLGQEAVAGIESALTNRTYDEVLAELEGSKKFAAETYPDAYAAGGAAGSLAAPSLGMGKLIAAAPGIAAKIGAGALGGGLLGGIYGAGDNPDDRMGGARDGAIAGALGGGAITGLSTAAQKIINALMQRNANKAFINSTPSAETLADDAGKLYDEGRLNGATATPKQTRQLLDDITTLGRSEAVITPAGRITNEMSSLNSAFRLLKDYAGKPMTPTEMQSVRAALTDALQNATGNEARVARKMLEQFDSFVAPLVPSFSKAAEKYSLAKGGESVDELAKLAEARAGQFSNSGMENAIRTEARGLDRKIIKGQERGYTPDEIALIEAMAAQPGKIAGTINKFAPNGLIPIMASGGAGAAGASALGLSGPVGMAIAGGLAGGGALTRMGLTAAQTNRLALLNALRRTAEGVAPKGAKVDAGIMAAIRDALMKGTAIGAQNNAP